MPRRVTDEAGFPSLETRPGLSGEGILIEPELIRARSIAAADQPNVMQGAIADVRGIAAKIKAIREQTKLELLPEGANCAEHDPLPKIL
jgi:hypothetical protein